MFPWCKESPQIVMLWWEWLGRLKWRATGLDAKQFANFRTQLFTPKSVTAQNLIITTPRTSCIYFKPKIHKPNNLGRPIVSACSCPTELISSYLDKVMTPIVKSLPSYIKDNNHALETFRNFNFSGENKIIFTMDITSLYTVIPNNEGLQALKYFFNQRPIKKPSSETLLRLAELVLTLNCFSFGDNYYKQINGVAMGTKMGPS